MAASRPPLDRVSYKLKEILKTNLTPFFIDSLDQLAEIRKVSLASLICENADTISKVQPLAFLRPGGFNAKLPCEQIPRMNLAVFKNEKLWDE